MKTVQFLLPSWTLCPLFNGDSSGITDQEDALLNNFVTQQLKENKYSCFHAIDCKDEGFCHRNDLDRFASDCHLITFDIGN